MTVPREPEPVAEGGRRREIVIGDPADAGKRLDVFLAERLGEFTRSQARRRIADLSLNGTPVRLSRRLREGDRVSFSVVEPEPSALEPQDIPLDVIYEDPRVIVIDKPQGMVVHPGSGNRRGTVVNALLFHAAGLSESFRDDLRPGIVHRLDKDTSGVMIAAKDPAAHEFLAAQFRDRSVRKRYAAIVRGALPSAGGRLEARIARDPRNRKRFTCVAAGGRPAVTRYRVVSRLEATGAGPARPYTLVLCAPRTGRTHQLRVHLKHAGTPILGDRVYGGTDPVFPEATLMLHALSLAIRLPGEAEPRTFRSRLPARFREILSRLQSFSPSEGL
jgi:23S rRNA pseudouridine1911/1915/1917 synthase